MTAPYSSSNTGAARPISPAIVNADVAAGAAIAGSKVDPTFGAQPLTCSTVIPTGNINVGSSGGGVLSTDIIQAYFTAAIACGSPILGRAAGTSVYGVHGKVAVTTTGSFSVAAADYVHNHIRLTGGTTGTVTFPLPATDAGAYVKFVGNASAVTKTITTGAGATVALLTATGAMIEFDNTVGCRLYHGAAVAYS